MKSPKPRIHKLFVSEPLLAYHNIVAGCGRTIQNAYPVYMVERELRSDISMPPWRLCRECRELLPETGEGGRYEYGLIESSEMRGSWPQEEEETEAEIHAVA